MQQITGMTSREAADKLGCHVRTVHKWIDAGKLEAKKVPGYRGAYLVDPAAVEKMLAASDD